MSVLSAVLLILVASVSSAEQHEGLEEIKGVVNDFFEDLNKYAQNMVESRDQCLETIGNLPEDVEVTIAGVSYEKDELQFFMCDYIPKVLQANDMQVEVTNVDQAAGNVVGEMALAGNWLKTGNEFEDIQLFWRMKIQPNQDNDKELKVIDIIPINPQNFTESAMTRATCGVHALWQSFLKEGQVDRKLLAKDVIFSAPNMYAFKSEETSQTEFTQEEMEDFMKYTVGAFNFNGTQMKHFEIIDADDNNALLAVKYANLTTRKGKTDASDITFWVDYEFEEMNETDGSNGEQEKTEVDEQQQEGQEGICDALPKLKNFRLLLSRPLQIQDVVDLGEILDFVDEDLVQGKSQDVPRRSAQREDENEEEDDQQPGGTKPIYKPKQEDDLEDAEDTGDSKDAKDTEDSAADTQNATDADNGNTTIVAEENFFSEPSIEISVGEKVSFVGLGPEHRVIQVNSLTSNSTDVKEGGFDSKGEKQLTVAFNESGTFYYLDEQNYERGMRGKIIVEDKGGEQ